MFRNEEHSVQKNLLATLLLYNIINITRNIVGNRYVPINIFHIKDIIPEIVAVVRCSCLSESKYLGKIPTVDRDTTERNGKN